MTRISRDVPSLDMKRRSMRNEHENGSVTRFEGETYSTWESGSVGNEDKPLKGTEREPIKPFSAWKSSVSNLTCLPGISSRASRSGYVCNKPRDTPRPKLQRSKTNGFKSSSNRTNLTFKQLSLQTKNELDEHLLARKNSHSSNYGISESANDILERSYTDALEELDSDSRYQSHIPYFAKWKISGYKDDKVILTSLTNMSETQEVTPEFVQYIKERDTAVEEAKKAQTELRETQCKLYDSMLLIEELEKKLKEGETKQKPGKTSNKRTTTAKKRGSDASLVKGSALSLKASAGASSSGVSSARTSFVSSTRPENGGLYHPPVLDLDPATDSREYYWKLAEKFQTLPMYQVLDAEKKFIKADTDNSGYIDKTELDKVLSDNVGLFTPAQLDAIFEEIDLDHSETLDFYEVLFVLNKLFSRRKTNLPQSVQQNYTKTCSVQ